MEEIWKVIADSDGHYYISNYGRFKREEYTFINSCGATCHRTEAIKDAGILNKSNGYLYYKYRNKDGIHISSSAHRLVALHFVSNPNPIEYIQVNHIDGNKTNNYYKNLEWVSRKLNMEHASQNGLINTASEKRKQQTKINQKKAVDACKRSTAKYDKDGNLIEIIPNVDSISVQRLTYKGFTYRYCDILLNKYGYVPNQLDVSHSFNASTKKRKKYIENKENGEIKTYLKISDLPISREQLWVAFNNQIPDTVNGSFWNIIDVGANELPKKIVKGVAVVGYDDKGNITKKYDSLQELSKDLNFKGFNWFNKCVKEHIKYKGYYWEKIYD